MCLLKHTHDYCFAPFATCLLLLHAPIATPFAMCLPLRAYRSTSLPLRVYHYVPIAMRLSLHLYHYVPIPTGLSLCAHHYCAYRHHAAGQVIIGIDATA